MPQCDGFTHSGGQGADSLCRCRHSFEASVGQRAARSSSVLGMEGYQSQIRLRDHAAGQHDGNTHLFATPNLADSAFLAPQLRTKLILFGEGYVFEGLPNRNLILSGKAGRGTGGLLKIGTISPWKAMESRFVGGPGEGAGVFELFSRRTDICSSSREESGLLEKGCLFELVSPHGGTLVWGGGSLNCFV